jgi:hypothetical protein
MCGQSPSRKLTLVEIAEKARDIRPCQRGCRKLAARWWRAEENNGIARTPAAKSRSPTSRAALREGCKSCDMCEFIRGLYVSLSELNACRGHMDNFSIFARFLTRISWQPFENGR